MQILVDPGGLMISLANALSTFAAETFQEQIFPEQSSMAHTFMPLIYEEQAFLEQVLEGQTSLESILQGQSWREPILMALNSMGLLD